GCSTSGHSATSEAPSAGTPTGPVHPNPVRSCTHTLQRVAVTCQRWKGVPAERQSTRVSRPVLGPSMAPQRNAAYLKLILEGRCPVQALVTSAGPVAPGDAGVVRRAGPLRGRAG